MKSHLKFIAPFFFLQWPSEIQAQVPSPHPVPNYVTDYAPLFYFHSQEKYFPQRIETHLQNVNLNLKYTPVPDAPPELDMENLDDLNRFTSKGDGTDLYLTSRQVVAGNGSAQAFLYGLRPDPISGASAAPAICVIADKGDGVVDAFWFLFYSLYRGNFAIPEYGTHVADWAYMTIRFMAGEPQALWLSQHQSGTAISYEAIEKDPHSGRPIIYLANGTHATWATTGLHDYSKQYNLPRGFAVDRTDRGILWDPMVTPPMYFTAGLDDSGRTSFEPTAENPWYTSSFLNYSGIWGDKQYKDSVPGQLVVLGRHKYVDGPPGPRWRNIGSIAVCPDGVSCAPATALAPGM